uniref:40S ribosomal protein S25 n=1 Tax=Globodera pallida TaxID=36090 RepID=A0A183BP48_GLOPA
MNVFSAKIIVLMSQLLSPSRVLLAKFGTQQLKQILPKPKTRQTGASRASIRHAMQQARIKGLGQVKKGQREAKFCLTNELLQPVLEEYGIQMDRPPFYQ